MQRRYFFGTALAGAAFAGTSPSDKVNIAIIGVRGRGRALAGEFAKLAMKAVEEKKIRRPPLIGDLRRALDDKSVDAVVIAAPDYWHVPATLLACEAGKDVQPGTQARSRPVVQRAVELVHSGKIGKVLMAKAWNVQLRDNIGHKADSPVPKGVDYDTWTGPAPLLPFNQNRFHYNWHWNWNYGTGDRGNDGVHQMDIARWALGTGVPVEAAGSSRKLFFDDDRQTPNADIEIGRASTLHCHLGNIVARTGRNIRFDPKTETIAQDAGASRFPQREYRKHWSTPRS